MEKLDICCIPYFLKLQNPFFEQNLIRNVNIEKILETKLFWLTRAVGGVGGVAE